MSVALRAKNEMEMHLKRRVQKKKKIQMEDERKILFSIRCRSVLVD
jgi:hypothetical protein